MSPKLAKSEAHTKGDDDDGEPKKKTEKPKKASVAKCLIVQFFFLFHSTVLCYNKARDISLFCTRRTPKIYEHNVSPHSRCMNTYTRTYTETPTNISLWYSASAPSLSFWLHCTKIEYIQSANRSDFSNNTMVNSFSLENIGQMFYCWKSYVHTFALFFDVKIAHMLDFGVFWKRA